MHKILEITLTDYMPQEKKEEEYLQALKTVLTHRYNSMTTYKSADGYWSQPPEIKLTIGLAERK